MPVKDTIIVTAASRGLGRYCADQLAHLRKHLQKQLCPHRITIGAVPVSHRFKQQ